MKKPFRPREEGAAVVETAILMLILVPLLLYAAFSGEAGMHLIETQEQVVASLWDFSMYPYRLDKTHGSPKHEDKNKRGSINSTSLIEEISSPNRVQYVDHDSSFSNAAIFKDGNNYVEAKEESYRTEAFVSVTHCDANNNNCQDNRPQNYEGTYVHEVACVLEEENIGNFTEGSKLGGSKTISSVTVNLSGVGAVRAKANGGLVKCQAKARLKNYLLPKTFLPEFNSTELYGGEHYSKEDGPVQDGKNVTQMANGGLSDIVVRHRFVLLTDHWGLNEPISEHQNSELPFTPLDEGIRGGWDGLFPKRTHFQETVNSVRNAAVFLVPAIWPVLDYSQKAASSKIALVLGVPDMGDRITGGLSKLAEVVGVPNIMSLYMVAHYASHNGRHSDSGLEGYKYIPALDYSGWSGLGQAIVNLFGKDRRSKHFTTPFYDKSTTKYATAYNRRGKYYMGMNSSGASNN